MSFSFRSDSQSTEIVLLGEPSYCHALKQAPAKMEAILKNGLWLVMLYAVWSVPDRVLIASALTIAKEMGGAVNLGVRPFFEFEEIESWCPDFQNTTSSPVWLVLSEGCLIRQFVHPRPDELITFLRSVATHTQST